MINIKTLGKIWRLRAQVNDLKSVQSKANAILDELATQNELLRRDLESERQRRADDLERVELRLLLQLSEELRRLPPSN